MKTLLFFTMSIAAVVGSAFFLPRTMLPAFVQSAVSSVRDAVPDISAGTPADNSVVAAAPQTEPLAERQDDESLAPTVAVTVEEDAVMMSLFSKYGLTSDAGAPNASSLSEPEPLAVR